MINEETFFYVEHGADYDKLIVYHKLSGIGPTFEVLENIKNSYDVLFPLRSKIKEHLVNMGFSIYKVDSVSVRSERPKADKPGYFLSYFTTHFYFPRPDTDELIKAVSSSGLARFKLHYEEPEKFPSPSVENFARLAKENPDKLERWLHSGLLNYAQLTFALEEVKGFEDRDHAVKVLLQFSNDPSSLVREGAICGMEEFVDFEVVRERLTEMANTDDHEWLRKSAAEALEDTQ